MEVDHVSEGAMDTEDGELADYIDEEVIALINQKATKVALSDLLITTMRK
jgi:hypothetical protein